MPGPSIDYNIISPVGNSPIHGLGLPRVTTIPAGQSLHHYDSSGEILGTPMFTCYTSTIPGEQPSNHGLGPWFQWENPQKVILPPHDGLGSPTIMKLLSGTTLKHGY